MYAAVLDSEGSYVDVGEATVINIGQSIDSGPRA